MKRGGPLKRSTPLARGSKPMARSRMRRRKPKGQPAERKDEAFLAWLRRQPCCMCRRRWTASLPNHAHHPRRSDDEPVGGGQKAPDQEALTLCPSDPRDGWKGCHDHRHEKTGPFSGWSKDEVADWERWQNQRQRALYERSEDA